jgi:stearoyl-CoA desaturase (Delta-9 desaturase)
MRRAVRAELARLKPRAREHSARWPTCGWPRRWLHRDDDKIPQGVKPQLARRWRDSPRWPSWWRCARNCAQLWTRTNVSAEQLVADLQAWCKKAEDSGIAALQEFSLKLRAAHACRYFSLISLYSTCLRAFGSNFRNSSFSGVVFLFLLVV